MQFWNELEGQTIDGLFPLRRLVRSEGRSAWFETETPAPQIGRATICLIEALTDGDEVIARLQAAQRVKHPNLVEIAQVGQVSVDNTQVVYAVMEPIEQSLSDVLQSQALSADEGREVAEALVGALTSIHQHGMSHGHVEAASVLATEETVKLRSDCLQTSAASQAEDVVGVGNTLFHAFTQRKAANATDAQVNRIPAPFGEIVRNALARRWSLAQIANALKPTPPVPVPMAPPPAARRVDPLPAKVPEVVAAPSPAPLPPVAQTPPPAQAPASVASQATLFPENFEVSGSAKRRPVALYGVLALVVLAIIGWALLRRPAATPADATTASTPAVTEAPVAAPAPAPAVKPSAAMTPLRSHKPAPEPADASTAGAAATPSNGRSIWRVIVYTYKGQSKAAESVSKIQSKHPDLEPAVFSLTGSDNYMVTLGGAMDHPHATAMLAKARREGLPQDTFVRNFSQ